ncbi:hypothetical protein [Aquitalea sp. LB_tupeE]|uniref:hypothetical protein n=1 Tax=Aquitalea sp. LB_tupeE TaxID=2748078 RepID=UPI0015BE93D6|nr:hypothetical protein [Aquitalea sp. LB_tupeE]NWK77691.1 hypothetical protein [Aquitalea sp. LB_tupeE]
MRSVVSHPFREAVNDFINKNANRPMANKVLHAHRSPMHWKVEYDHQRFDQALQNSAQQSTSINFYIGIPFCLPTDPPHCGFCLFPTTAYQESLPFRNICTIWRSMFHRYELSCNVDMIYGWPEQSIDSMLDGLRRISAAGVHHITHYELNIAGRSHFATKQRAALPSQDEKYEMYKIAQQFLQEKGFVQKTAYDWERRSVSSRGDIKPWEYLYEQNLRQPFSGGETNPKCYMGA